MQVGGEEPRGGRADLTSMTSGEEKRTGLDVTRQMETEMEPQMEAEQGIRFATRCLNVDSHEQPEKRVKSRLEGGVELKCMSSVKAASNESQG